MRCRCFMLPITLTYKELGLNIPEMKKSLRPFTERGPGRKILDVGQFDGDFKKFLSTRSIKYQKDLLGPTRYSMLKKGEISWDDLVDKNGNTVLLKRAKEGGYSGLVGNKKKYKEPKIVPVKAVKKTVVKEGILSPSQVKAIQFAEGNGKLTDDRMAGLMRAFKDLSITEEDIKKISEKLSATSKIHINVPVAAGGQLHTDLLKHGRLKNQFELGDRATSGGTLGAYKGSDRDIWERTITNGALHSSVEYLNAAERAMITSIGKERPLYGYVQDAAHDRINGRYGDVTIVLKSGVNKRSTMTWGNSSMLSERSLSKGDLFLENENYKPVRTFLSNVKRGDTSLKTEMARKTLKGFSPPDYIESQVYGGVKLGRDVEAIIVNKDLPHIKDLADKWNIKYIVVEQGKL